MTMPVRLASWDRLGNPPHIRNEFAEGYLRETGQSFAKATGTFDDLDLLAIVGRSQIIGRLHSAPDAQLDEQVPFHSIGPSSGTAEAFVCIPDLTAFARYSGIAGVNRIMIRDEAAAAILESEVRRLQQHVQGRPLSLKFWGSCQIPTLGGQRIFLPVAAERPVWMCRDGTSRMMPLPWSSTVSIFSPLWLHEIEISVF